MRRELHDRKKGLLEKDEAPEPAWNRRRGTGDMGDTRAVVQIEAALAERIDGYEGDVTVTEGHGLELLESTRTARVWVALVDELLDLGQADRRIFVGADITRDAAADVGSRRAAPRWSVAGQFAVPPASRAVLAKPRR